MSVNKDSRTCTAPGCERRSALPLPYEQRCAKHYLQDVDRAQREAHERFEVHIAALKARKIADRARHLAERMRAGVVVNEDPPPQNGAAGRLCPGDIIAYPFGMRREIDLVTVHDVHTYPTGDQAIRYRYTSNPQGIDWRGFVDREDPDVRLLARGVGRVDTSVRSLVP